MTDPTRDRVTRLLRLVATRLKDRTLTTGLDEAGWKTFGAVATRAQELIDQVCGGGE